MAAMDLVWTKGYGHPLIIHWVPEQPLLLPPPPIDGQTRDHLVFLPLKLLPELVFEAFLAQPPHASPRREDFTHPWMVLLLLYAPRRRHRLLPAGSSSPATRICSSGC